jgi:hypothetical protein
MSGKTLTQHKNLLQPRNEAKRMQAKKADEGMGTSPVSSLCQQPIVNLNSYDFLLTMPNARAGFNSQLKRLLG